MTEFKLFIKNNQKVYNSISESENETFVKLKNEVSVKVLVYKEIHYYARA